MPTIKIIAYPWEELPSLDPSKAIVILIDTLRATTTIITCLARNASIVIPVETIEEAFLTRELIGATVLVGEKESIIIKGFDLGNSPSDCYRYQFNFKPVIIKSTNGTPIIRSLSKAPYLFAASIINLSSVVSTVLNLMSSTDLDVFIIEAGDNKKFSPPDHICAALIKNKLMNPLFPIPDHSLIYDVLAMSPHGIDLIKKGFQRDLLFSSNIDYFDIVPIFNGLGFISYPNRYIT